MFSLLNSWSQKSLKYRREDDNVNMVKIVHGTINISFHYHERKDMPHDLVPHMIA